jgi:hypothetical protein
MVSRTMLFVILCMPVVSSESHIWSNLSFMTLGIMYHAYKDPFVTFRLNDRELPGQQGGTNCPRKKPKMTRNAHLLIL